MKQDFSQLILVGLVAFVAITVILFATQTPEQIRSENFFGGAIKTSENVAFIDKNIPSTVEFCQYTNTKDKKPLATTKCDPLEQRKYQDEGYRFDWKLGYAFAKDQPAPQGTVELCRYTHPQKGHFTTTSCTGKKRELIEGDGPWGGYTYEEKLGYVLREEQPAGTKELCQYKHKEGHYFTTTVCNGENRVKLEGDGHWGGYRYLWKLGYVFWKAPMSPAHTLWFEGKPVAEVSLSSEIPRKLFAQGSLYPSEISPLVVSLDNDQKAYIFPTGWTLKCTSSDNYLLHPVTHGTCDLITKQEIQEGVTANGPGKYKPVPPPSKEPWKRSYHGVFGIHVVGSGNNKKVIGFTGNENSNVQKGKVFYPNTIKKQVNRSCVNIVGQPHCWAQMSMFASMVSWDYDKFLLGEEGREAGPVVWSSKKYEEEYSSGPYHTTSFVDGNDVYVYFTTYSKNLRGNWKRCRSAVKSTLGADGLPGPFQLYAGNGQFSGDALPAGFELSRIDEFYDVTVENKKCLFEYTVPLLTLWFNVAKIKGTPYYLGVEERFDWRTRDTLIILRISDNPAYWTESSEYVIDIVENAEWGVSKFTYPTFVDKEATTNYEITPNEEFYITGNQPRGSQKNFLDENRRYRLRAMKVLLELVR